MGGLVLELVLVHRHQVFRGLVRILHHHSSGRLGRTRSLRAARGIGRSEGYAGCPGSVSACSSPSRNPEVGVIA